jgi:hypothetical protein
VSSYVTHVDEGRKDELRDGRDERERALFEPPHARGVALEQEVGRLRILDFRCKVHRDHTSSLS